MHRYQVRESMVVVSRNFGAAMKIATLPVGAVLVVPVNTVQLQSGLIEATWEEQTVSVFIQDLKERADLVREAAW